MERDYAQEFMDRNFFTPETLNKPVGNDLFGYSLVEGDEVFVYQNSYLLIEKMKKTQIEMAKVMKLERRTL